MKKIAFILLAFTAITFSAGAQNKKEVKGDHQHHRHGKHGKHHGKHHKHHDMAKTLNFSEEQKKQAKLYHEDFRTKMQALNKQENITVKEQRDRKTALLKERKTKMDGLLTAEQKTKMSQLKTERKAKQDAHYAKRLDKMKTNLGLSETQVAQLKAQRSATGLKMKALRENESLGREQKKEQMMALRSEMKAAHQKIFTPEQMKKMEDMRKNHPEKNKAK